MKTFIINLILGIYEFYIYFCVVKVYNMATEIFFKQANVQSQINDMQSLIEEIARNKFVDDALTDSFILFGKEISIEVARKILEGIYENAIHHDQRYQILDVHILSYQIFLDKIRELQKLFAGLMTIVLSRTIMDFKSMFRTKVPLLFKNLDDAHATNLIYRIQRKSISYTKAFNITWHKIKYKKHYALQLQY